MPQALPSDTTKALAFLWNTLHLNGSKRWFSTTIAPVEQNQWCVLWYDPSVACWVQVGVPKSTPMDAVKDNVAELRAVVKNNVPTFTNFGTDLL